eukprot:356348-Chlamydomonas_euryale.AAC.3
MTCRATLVSEEAWREVSVHAALGAHPIVVFAAPGRPVVVMRWGTRPIQQEALWAGRLQASVHPVRPSAAHPSIPPIGRTRPSHEVGATHRSN